MQYLPENLLFTFGLTFRILFYSTFISLMFFERARRIRRKYKRQIGYVILFFATCYIGVLIPMFFDDKDYGGIPALFITVWSLFFFYLYLLNKLDNINLNLNKVWSVLLIICSLGLLFFCNSFLNIPSYQGTWSDDFIGGQFHAGLSFLLPIVTWLFININPKGAIFGLFIILGAVSQFILGLTFSYGIDGYISDVLEFSIIFILNSILFLYAGLYHAGVGLYQFYLSKKEIA